MSDRDLVVVGAGIHGAGVAQAAAAAGARVLLLEERHVAAGTSSRSSKLIHGGLRYLETAQFSLVRESLRERAILLHVAPHLVRLSDFLIPVYRDSRRGPLTIRAGLSLYAALGGLSANARFQAVPRADWDGLDGLATRDLVAVFRYQDGRTDDAALTRAVVRSARALGAEVREGARWLSAQRDGDGYAVHWSEGARVEECTTSALVLAGGPWTAELVSRATPRGAEPEVELVSGSHIEVEGEIARGVYYVESPTDRRPVFVMPWKGHTLIGTTERSWTGAPETVEPSPEEVEYLGACLHRYFPGRTGEFLGAFAGLRVLPRGGGSANRRPREVHLSVDDPAAPRRVAIYGGKLTGYRANALKVLERLRGAWPERTRRADTATLRLPEGD